MQIPHLDTGENQSPFLSAQSVKQINMLTCPPGIQIIVLNLHFGK